MAELPTHVASSLPVPTDVVKEEGKRIPARIRLPGGDEAPITQEIEEAPRPEGSYPRAVTHDEQVEYRYDPATGEFEAKVLSSSQPIVTGWDESPPQRDERHVGTWDIVPTNDGVLATNGQRVSVPEGIKTQLRMQAEQTGEAVVSVSSHRYQHDLDTRDTNVQRNRPGTPQQLLDAKARGRTSKSNGDLDPKYQQLLKHLQHQSRENRSAKGGGRRRASSSRAREKMASPSLPQIVITQEPMSMRRVGGL